MLLLTKQLNVVMTELEYDSVGSSLSNVAFSSEVGEWCVDKRCSGGAMSWCNVGGGGGSSSSKSSFSSEVYGDEKVDGIGDGEALDEALGSKVWSAVGLLVGTEVGREESSS